MGGMGSGRYGGFGRATCEDYRALDIRRLARDGLTEHGAAGVVRWSRDGEVVASIRLACMGGCLTLTYRTQSYGGEWQPVTERVYLDYTSQHFGGERRWFFCPNCRRRCAKLYGGARFLCRQCYGLGYASQAEDAPNRLLRRAQKLRMKLGGDGCVDEPFPDRPKGMHRRTFDRLCSQLDLLEADMWRATIQRFGLHL